MKGLETSVPKTTREETCEGEEPAFGCAADEALKFLKERAGKTLLLSDERSFPLLSAPSRSPRALALVFDGDCLPLFSMPDGVSGVVAAGRAETLRAARCFAEVRLLPCLLVPTEGSLSGVYEPRAELRFGDAEAVLPLKEGKVLCDLSAVDGAEAYGALLLARLAALEARALCEFGRSVKAEEVQLPAVCETEELVRENARLRRRERRGAYAGEGRTLAALLRERGERYPEWTAYLQLSALYGAFFEKGKPRRYFTPDYRARAKRAGTEYTLSGVPSAEEYVTRAIALERIRAAFSQEIALLAADREKFRATVSSLGGTEAPKTGGDVSLLERLPELAPGGLSAIVRDFGLMEWNHDERGTVI